MGGGFRSFKSEKQRMRVMAILNERHGGGKSLEGQMNATRILEQRHPTLSVVGTQKRRNVVLDKLKQPHLVMSDDEIQHIKNSLNRKEYGNEDNKKFADEANELIANHPHRIRLDEELTKKGLEYLTRPAIQKQLGEREKNVVEHFKEFTLTEFYEDNNGFRSFYIPQWSVRDNSGNSFEYIEKGSREIEVVG